jgi:hypothetical protein
MGFLGGNQDFAQIVATGFERVRKSFLIPMADIRRFANIAIASDRLL